MPDNYHYHFIGIGGIGMSAIAMALLKKGFSVSGSDLIDNAQINKLRISGAIIFKSQDFRNINFIEKKYFTKQLIVVISSAIKKTNKELAYCLKNKISIKHRSEILSSIMQAYTSIAIAGTHGKTSTSTFLSTLLDLCTNNSSSIIGGIQPIYNSNSHIKDSKYLVAEIDESDGSASNYISNLAVINNIDFDHCDFYSNIDEVISTFKKFAFNSQECLINYDCKKTRLNIPCDYRWSIKEIKGIEYSLIPEEITHLNTIAKYYENGKLIDSFTIPIPGLHNLSNIAGAIAVCRINKIKTKDIKEKIKYLELPKKRFEFRGTYLKRQIVDDYAHHPREIKTTIALGELFLKAKDNPSKRLVVIFQPHRYSRFEIFANEFAEALSYADKIIITNIYSAGETNINNINSSLIANKIENKNIVFLNDNYEIKDKFDLITQKMT